jgi:hypothetical protein
MDPLEFHPLADLFPIMTDAELDELGEDMLKHGQREPIWLYEGKILDGRNRYRACLMKGIEPGTTETRAAAPLAFVISLNLRRRHLDASQRAMVVAEIAKLPKGAHPPIGGSSPTQDVAAKLLNVSVRSGQRARYVKDHGTPDLVDAVKHGDVRVTAAAEFAKQNPPLDQHRLIAEHGSPAAAVKAKVKAKADRAVSKMPRPVADPKPAADRAERDQIHRYRCNALDRMLQAFSTLEQHGNPAQVAKAVMRLETSETSKKDTVSHLRRVAAFANEVVVRMENANASAKDRKTAARAE